MALNLWKIGGKPTSYNPLPSGYQGVNVPIGEFVLKFKAKSASGARFRTQSSSGANWVEINLTSNFVQYERVLNHTSSWNVLLLDVNTSGDIIIDSIELVQKPLPKRTINGIDTFDSGKWTLHANAKVIDADTLEINSTGTYQDANINFKVSPNTQYTMSWEVMSNQWGLNFLTDSGSYISGMYRSEKVYTFTTPSNCYQIKVYPSTTTLTTGTFRFTKPMLNLGSIPALYERKRGDKMVMPVPKRNLFDGVVESGYYVPSNGESTASGAHKRFPSYIDVLNGVAYYITKNTTNNFFVHYYNSSKTWIGSTQYTGKINVLLDSIPANASFIRFHFDDTGSAGVDYSKYVVFTEVQVNSKPKKYVAKKNLVNKYGLFTAIPYGETVQPTTYDSSNDLIVTLGVSGIKYGAGQKFYVIPNTSYSLTFTAVGQSQRIVIFPVNSASYILDTTVSAGNIKTVTFNSGNNTELLFTPLTVSTSGIQGIKDLQIEQGTTATPYEPYIPVLPKAKTGSAFNGQTDYFQLPSMTMDSIEIDCLIDSVQSGAFYYLIDARTGLTNGYVYHSGVGVGFSEVQVNGVVQDSTQKLNLIQNNKGQRKKFLFKSSTPFTDDVTVFAKNDTKIEWLKTILYKVTCYLAGVIVAQYDFEKPANVVGDKVIPNAKNLIPSFEDSRWSLHANAKVYGRDVLRLDATGQWQESSITLPVNGGTPFLYNAIGKNWLVIQSLDANLTTVQNHVNSNNTNPNINFTSHANAKFVRIKLSNDATGSFDFIKPQLYQLDGKEGTLVGKPQSLLRAPKRILYAKR